MAAPAQAAVDALRRIRPFDSEVVAVKLIWRVAEAPTGRYRAFQRRGWPGAHWPSGEPAVSLSCEDDYSPARARGEVPHAEIRVSIADHACVTTDGRPTFRWRVCKQRARSLDEAKQIAANVLAEHPQFHPKEKAK